MTSLATEALVLRTTEFGESDRIVRLLTPELGRVSAVAKGAKRSLRRFPGTLDLFNHLVTQLERRPRSSMMRLDQARLTHPFAGLRSVAGRFALACYLIELVDRLAPEGGARGDARRLFDFTLAALRILETSRPNEQLRTLLELRALAALGFRPELSCCVRCGGELGRSARTTFHVPEGGALCPSCSSEAQGALLTPLGTLRALEQSLRLPLERIDRLSLGPTALAAARRLMARFVRFHLGLELRSEAFLNEALPTPGLVPRDVAPRGQLRSPPGRGSFP